jgi:hypothetical protein
MRPLALHIIAMYTTTDSRSLEQERAHIYEYDFGH